MDGTPDLPHTAGLLAACRLEALLNQRKMGILHGKLTRFTAAFPTLPAERVTEYLEQNMEQASCSRKRYCSLLRFVPVSCRSTAETLLDLTLMEALYPDAADAIRETRFTVGIQTAYWMETGGTCPVSDAADLYAALYPFFLPEQKKNGWYAEVQFHADCRLTAYLSGSDALPPVLEGCCTRTTPAEELPPLLLYHSVRNAIADAWKQGNRAIQLRGKEQTGEKLLIKHAAKQCGSAVLFVDFPLLLTVCRQEEQRTLDLILREALLSQSVVCWCGVREDCFCGGFWNREVFAQLCVERLLRYGVSVCFCTEDGVDLSDWREIPVTQLQLPCLTRPERLLLWETLCRENACSGIDPVQFADRYPFSWDQILSVFRQRKTYCALEQESEQEIFGTICQRVAAPSEELFRIRKPAYQFSDLVLPAAELDRIREICDNFQYREKVYQEWNLREKLPYGRAISVLLCGPPGTGKTMTAHVIASRLGLPLFHADLSRITDKYIGETEKHLDTVFSEAEKISCVLLLDEADAICGKRSEVKDAKDRYSNNTTAFLLQRLEQYEGIVILATNFTNNLDDAFLRRMKYVLPFSMPDAALREKIWRSCFPEQLPAAPDLDFPYLAGRFSFSGANIKNVVVEASFLAAAEKEPVQMRHILRSIGNEYLKFQKRILPGEFGEYSELYASCLPGGTNS